MIYRYYITYCRNQFHGRHNCLHLHGSWSLSERLWQTPLSPWVHGP